MTVAHHVAPVVADDAEAAVRILRADGRRVTAARRRVIEALFAVDEPVSAERIADGLDGLLPRSDVASTYRNLETLEQLGLVRHLHVGHGPGQYVLAGRERREFVACERCGALAALEPAQLDGVRAAVRAATGFEARFSHFPIVGLCAGCAREGGHAHP
ncbi:Fe2+/Zn2+ uptake regulation protein-like protein [Conexibacter woesei DSM 14684]|uniref:Fe2+/Zn2+ uptake regulation protein-like protein n=1 Tax=Conexibacter woesei (strain DSM 14684 / CCUG 47730 / CIP 108061 / JCM 11494 / NBRC 100937 / ID131577) TaxID=469383 RepID=D3F6Q8_CONWI|nr:Fe2+/Zn2+ uptake regulation protein-like protein [Conexibacter woesei DSM 14684]